MEEPAGPLAHVVPRDFESRSKLYEEKARAHEQSWTQCYDNIVSA